MMLAKVISTVTEPMVMVLLLAFLSGIHAGLSATSFVSYAVYLLVLSGIIAVARMRFMRSLRTNWDVSERPKRVRLLLYLLGFTVLFFLSLGFWQSSSLAGSAFLFLVWLVGFFVITLKTKISGHVGIFTMTVGCLAWWFGASFLWLGLLIPAVGWARLVQKRHTPIEVVGGFLYSAGILMVARLFL